jgi:ribonuclease HII
MMPPPAAAIRRDAGLWGYERALRRHGLGPVAGVDEAGRGACAGPLVVAAVVLPSAPSRGLAGIADSKLLTPAARERCYDQIVDAAPGWSTVAFEAATIDRIGLHVANIAGMRRAVARLPVRPGYVLTDGFAVPGLGVGALAVLGGDRVAACIAAASIIAKVTRDRIMRELDARFPEYDFAQHKGYVTATHAAALARHGPCEEHRWSYANVARAADTDDRRTLRLEETVAITSLRGATESA